MPIEEFDRLTDSGLPAALRTTVETSLLPGWHLTESRVNSVRNRTYPDAARRSRSSALVTYDLVLKRRGSSETNQTTLYVRAFLDGRGSRFSVAGGRSPIEVPTLDAYAWLFPADPAMPNLEAITDPAVVAARLPYPFPDSAIRSPADVSVITINPLRYKPEDRCTLNITVDDQSGTPRSLIAKVFSEPERARNLHQTAAALWQRSCEPDACFDVPQPLWLDSTNTTLWLSHLAGRSPRREELDDPTARRIGVALASFHRSDPVLEHRRDSFEQLNETAEKARRLAELFPVVGRPLRELVDHLEDGPNRFGQVPGTQVHGAFRLRQLLVDSSNIGIIDFDSIAIGDPLQDVADLLVDLDPSVGASGRCPRSESFLVAYHNASGAELDLERLRWHIEMQLLKRAFWLRGAARGQESVLTELVRRVHRAHAAASSPLPDGWRC